MTAQQRGEQGATTSADGLRCWVSAHLFYQGDIDDLLVQLVGPLVDELSTDAMVADWFYLRYWDGGPHVRLRFRCAHAAERAVLEKTITRRSETFFRARPSPGSWNEDAYLRIAEQLARMEGLDTYALAMYPNNSTRFIGYEPEFARYGTGESMRAAERHFGESSRISLALVREGTSGQRRLNHSFAAILVAWLSATRDRGLVARWATHRLSGVATSGDPLMGGLDGRYERQKRRLTALARQIEARPEHEEQTSPIGRWSASMVRLRDALAETERHTLPAVNWPGGDASPEATCVLPVLDLCAHLFCNRLGVLPHEEQYVRYLAYRALFDVDEEDQPHE